MAKFTFKTNNPTGAYRTFSTPTINVKLNKIICGSINYEYPHEIRLQIIKENINEDGNSNCDWKWIQFTKKFKSLNDAKNWLNDDDRLKRLKIQYNILNHE